MWIFSESCSFLSRLNGVIILKGMFPRSMGQYFFFSVVFSYIDSIFFVTCLKTTLYGRTITISVCSVSACQGVTDLINEFYVLLTVHPGTTLSK